MKEIIEEIRKSRLKPEEIWFINYIKDLEDVKCDKYPESIFFKKDGEVVFELELKYNCLYCSYIKIWSVFQDKHSLKYYEIETIIRSIMEEYLNLKFLSIQKDLLYHLIRWNKI